MVLVSSVLLSCSSVKPPFTIAPEELPSEDVLPSEELSDDVPSEDVLPSDAALPSEVVPSEDVLPSEAVPSDAVPSEVVPAALLSPEAVLSLDAESDLPAVLAAEPVAALFSVESPRIAKLSTDS